MTTLEDLLNRRHAASLIIAFLQQTITAEQSSQLEEWLDSGDNESLFGKLIDPNESAFSSDWFAQIDRDTDLYNTQE